MHFMSPVAGAMLLCTCVVLSNLGPTAAIQEEPDDGRAFNEPKTKKSGKLPRWSFDVGFLKVDSYFSEQKLEDRLRLSKSYIKHHIWSKFMPTEDPLLTMKHSRVEELLNCENLTTLIEPASRVPMVDCRPLEKHTMDETYVSPVSDLSITQYVRRSSFRLKHGGVLTKRSTRNDMLIYPLRKDVVLKHIESYVTKNNIGDPKSIRPNINLGYYVHADIGSSESPLVVTCTGDVFLSINRTERGYTRIVDDPYPEYIDDLYFLLDQASQNGYLFSMQEFKCGKSGSLADYSLNKDFTIMQRKVFPYLFVRHKMTTSPIDLFLKYEAKVDQVRHKDSDASDPHPESYNTTVKIKSSSGLVDFMNFILDQSISNDDIKTGYETANFINTNFPVLVTALWNKDTYVKQFRFLKAFKSLDGLKLPLLEMFNISYADIADKDAVTVMLDIKKSIIENFSMDNLSKVLDLDGTVEYDTRLEDEQSLREEL